MLVNVSNLSKKAVDAALKKDWPKAIDINLEILEKNPKDKEAKIRLGRAYIKTEKFSKAKKLFKEILEVDPINQIALKNFKLASENNPDRKGGNGIEASAKSLIKEPGTTKEIILDLPKNILLEPGEKLELKVTKTSITFLNSDASEKIGIYKDKVVSKIHELKKQNKSISASLIKVNGKSITILLKCAEPIFKSEKQSEKPYMIKGTIEEPELVIPELDDDIEE